MKIRTDRNDPFDLDCAEMNAVNEENLRRILADNAETEYGRAIGFDRIGDEREYRKRTPLIEYEEVGNSIERMYAGEKDVLTAYPLTQFIRTSGTSGKRKLVPLTEEALGRYGNIKDRINRETMGLKSGCRRLQLVTYRTDPTLPPEKETLFSIANERNLFRRGWLDTEEFIGGRLMYFQPEMTSFFYPKLWAALLEPETETLESPFLYDHLLFFRYLEEHWRQITEDIRSHRISEPEGIPQAVRDHLLSLPAPAARLEAVQAECACGFEGIAARLWPRMHAVCGIRGSVYSAEDSALEYYTKGISRHFFCFVSSECFMGIPMRMNEAVYTLMPRSAFYEFQPYDSDDHGGETLLPRELEIGKDYEIIVTNFSGLYRYHTYDVVRVEDFYGESPMVSFRLRRNLALNLCGEKFDSLTLQHAGTLLCGRLGFPECSFALDTASVPGKYLCFAEAEAVPSAEKRAEDRDTLERVLRELNPEYDDLRRLKCIAEAELCYVEKGAHRRVKQLNDSAAEQNKPLQILRDPAMLKAMREMLLRR
ncbi:MAG: GH3 auxin-responsive promoter family protein [Oscillospiraceae bacterium]|nr:GH3 auxin-responsive promoter family protein [Oscillospiraceae bacterium]